MNFKIQHEFEEGVPGKDPFVLTPRQQAMSEILAGGGFTRDEALAAALKRLSDTNLFALYLDLFGRPFGLRAEE